jgi:hypothetical protein
MTLNAENKEIRFPKQHYVGIAGRTGDDLPLGFMTEDGTDKAAAKRKETVDKWVRGYGAAARNMLQKPEARAVDNVPLIGFRLGRSIRHNSGWGQGNVKWRIEDPRGFELEISSPNMAQVFSACVIDNGEILEECVWARLKGDNVLVPITSELYQTAQVNSERLTKSVKPSSVKPGNRVILKNGTEGIYYGKFYTFERDYESGSRHYYYNGALTLYDRVCSDKPRHVVVDDAGKVHDAASFKPAEIVDATQEWDIAEMERRYEEKRLQPREEWYYRIEMRAASVIPDLGPIRRRPVQLTDLIEGDDVGLAELHGEWAVFQVNRNHTTNNNSAVVFCIIDYPKFVEDGVIEFISDTTTRQYGGRNQPKVAKIPYAAVPWAAMKLEGLYREVTTPHGTTITIPLT